jgi:hypothetical protein
MEARGRQTARNLIFFDAPIAAFFTVDRRLEAGSWFDCGLLAQTFMLAAKARGLDTCPQIFLTKYHSVVRRHLPIDDSQIMLCGMSIGYADTSSVEYTINSMTSSSVVSKPVGMVRTAYVPARTCLTNCPGAILLLVDPIPL